MDAEEAEHNALLAETARRLVDEIISNSIQVLEDVYGKLKNRQKSVYATHSMRVYYSDTINFRLE